MFIIKEEISTFDFARIKAFNNSDSQLYRILCYLFVFASVLCGTVMWHYLNGVHIPSAGKFKILLSIIGALLICLNSSYRKRDIENVFFILGYLGVYSFFTYDTAFEYLAKYVVPITILIFLIISQIYHNNIYTILNMYSQIMVVIATVSLFFWIFGSILDILPFAKTEWYYWASRYKRTVTYGYVYFINHVQDITLFGNRLHRNTAIWAEAPGCVSKFIYALVIQLTRKEHHRYYKFSIIVLVLAIISTLSTKGFVILSEIAIIYFFVFYKPTQRNNKYFKLIGTVSFIPLVLILLYQLIIIKSGTVAFSHRIDSAFAGLHAWADNLLFGVGFGNNEDVLEYLDTTRVNTGISMGLSTLLGEGGLYLTLFVLFPFFRLYKILKNTDYFKYYVLISIVALTDLLISNIFAGVEFMYITAFGYAALICGKKTKMIF